MTAAAAAPISQPESSNGASPRREMGDEHGASGPDPHGSSRDRSAPSRPQYVARWRVDLPRPLRSRACRDSGPWVWRGDDVRRGPACSSAPSPLALARALLRPRAKALCFRFSAYRRRIRTRDERRTCVRPSGGRLQSGLRYYRNGRSAGAPSCPDRTPAMPVEASVGVSTRDSSAVCSDAARSSLTPQRQRTAT